MNDMRHYLTLLENMLDNTVWWHGSGSDKMLPGITGLHLGTKKGAEEALNARIGVPVEGYWDGTRKYGETKLAGQKTLKQKGYYPSGHNCYAPEEDYYIKDFSRGLPDVSHEVKMRLDFKPSIRPFTVIGKMSNTPKRLITDEGANRQMYRNIKKGIADKGYYYKNISEDAGSVSVVVPNVNFLKPVS